MKPMHSLSSLLFEQLRQTRAERVSYEGGSTILEADIRNRIVFLLEEGKVQIKTQLGERIHLSAPNVFGEISSVTGKPTIAEVSATGEVKVRLVKHQDIAEAFPDNEGFRRLYSELSRLCVERASGKFHKSYVALVAHDALKSDLADFVASNADYFETKAIIATKNTAIEIEKSGVSVARRVRSGARGGDQQIGSLIAQGLIESVFFFRDPMWAAPHGADVHALVRVCELENILLATNLATAHALVSSCAVAQGLEGRG